LTSLSGDSPTKSRAAMASQQIVPGKRSDLPESKRFQTNLLPLSSPIHLPVRPISGDGNLQTSFKKEFEEKNEKKLNITPIPISSAMTPSTVSSSRMDRRKLNISLEPNMSLDNSTQFLIEETPKQDEGDSYEIHNLNLPSLSPSRLNQPVKREEPKKMETSEILNEDTKDESEDTQFNLKEIDAFIKKKGILLQKHQPSLAPPLNVNSALLMADRKRKKQEEMKKKLQELSIQREDLFAKLNKLKQEEQEVFDELVKNQKLAHQLILELKSI